MSFIYLDHNATTPLLPEAHEAMRTLWTDDFGNPSSAHRAGRKARQALEDARERIAFLLGAETEEVTFTSGATEANNLAVFGLMQGARQLERSSGPTTQILASHLEHPCVVEPLRQLERRGIVVVWLTPSPRGVLLPETVRTGLTPETRLVCLMLANHETGAIQPVAEVAAMLPAGIALHCDAAQAAGKIPVNFRSLGATTLTVSAHKFGGPKGVGVLVARRGTPLAPQIYGGHQQQGRRPGTEPVPLAVGMAAALEACMHNMTVYREKLANLRKLLWSRLLALAAPVVLNGPEINAADVVPTTLNVSFPGCRADLLLLALDLAGVACSTGSACSSGSLLPSPVLAAMGTTDDVLRSALRFSFIATTSPAEIEDAADRISKVVASARTTGAPSEKT